MEKPYSGAVVIDSNAEEIAKLRARMKKGETLFKLGKSSLVVTLLSPFDFEGPIAEIISAVIAAVGFTMKKQAEVKINELTNSDANPFDEKANAELKSVVNNMFKNF